MSGIQNQPNVPGTTPFQATPRPVGSFNSQPLINLGMAVDQLNLAGGATPPAAPVAPAPQPAAPTQDLSAWRAVLNGSSAIDAVMAISQLAGQAGANRAAVVQLLMETAQSPTHDQRVMAAVDALAQIHATEAAPLMRQLMASGDAATSAAAHDAFLTLGGPQAPAGGNTPPGAPVPPAVATTPVQAAPNAGPAPMTPELAQLAAKMTQGVETPMASVQLANLPTDQMVAVANYLVNTGAMDDNKKMVVAALANRASEPLAQEALRKYAALKIEDYHGAAGAAALALATTLQKQPSMQNLATILTFMAHPFYESAPTKRAILDLLSKNPQALGQPATVATIGAILYDNMADRDLQMAASHAMAQLHTPQSRSALVHSPLLKAWVPRLQLRALWDLKTQPGPYPEAQAELQELAKSVDPDVQRLAKELLAKKN